MKKFKFVFLAVILCCFATLIGVVGCTDKPTTEKPVEERKTSSSDPIIGTWFCEDEKIDENILLQFGVSVILKILLMLGIIILAYKEMVI